MKTSMNTINPRTIDSVIIRSRQIDGIIIDPKADALALSLTANLGTTREEQIEIEYVDLADQVLAHLNSKRSADDQLDQITVEFFDDASNWLEVEAVRPGPTSVLLRRLDEAESPWRVILADDPNAIDETDDDEYRFVLSDGRVFSCGETGGFQLVTS